MTFKDAGEEYVIATPEENRRPLDTETILLRPMPDGVRPWRQESESQEVDENFWAPTDPYFRTEDGDR